MIPWIPVTEKLPENNVEVLKFVKNWKGYNSFITLGCFEKGHENECVTHWMPLPEFPEEQDK
jgi:hypothetical protein